MAPETLSRILSGAHARPSFESVWLLCKVLGVPVSWALGEEGALFTPAEERVVREFMSVATKRLSHHDSARPNVEPVEGSTRIPSAYAARGAKVIYKALGDSMTGAGIGNGDLVYVKPTNDYHGCVGKVVVARLHGRLYLRRLSRDRSHLLSASDLYDPLRIESREHFVVVGLVVGKAGEVV